MILFKKPGMAILALAILMASVNLNAQSVYTLKPEDRGALYFTPGAFAISADGKHDVSDSLQAAINRLKKERNYGILFIPEGKYLLSKTIYIPKAIRLIGYGKTRPEFILARNTPGYQEGMNYMFWFTDRMVEAGQRPRDAGAGTFYSAISNIDFRIEKGNPAAVALRTHFAQHGFVSHCDFHLDGAYAGIHDLGNEVEDLRFSGGQYGIVTSRSSPGWPVMVVDLYFEGQEKAAILSRNAGLAVVSIHVKNTPVAVELEEDVADRLFMEDCLFEHLQKGVVIGDGEKAVNQVNLRNIACRDVPVAVHFTLGGKQLEGKGKQYRIREFAFGLVVEDMASGANYRTLAELEEVDGLPEKLNRTIPSSPPMEDWVNVRDLGAVGDGIADDTEVLQEAMASHACLYFPSGQYLVSKPLKMKEGNCLVGMHPFATQLKIAESTPAFSGFGPPVPLLESSEGGADQLNGIGINTGAYNYRAVGLKWMAGATSLVNDVKFVGGHGTMAPPGERSEWRGREREISSPSNPVHDRGKDQAWDQQYWSLWVTNGGGGILKDIWTASTYASTGFYVSNTSTPGRVYAMSIEHHVRQECRLNRVANWKFYAFQFEEEGLEGKACQTLDMNECRNLDFANFWMYRTIRVKTPRHWGIRVSGCTDIRFMNMRSWTQVLHLPERTIFDMDRDLSVYPGDFALAVVSGKEASKRSGSGDEVKIDKLSFDHEFATGAVADSRGNVYYCDHQAKRVYKWSADTETVSIYADYPYKPFSLAVDTQDHLIVICRYDPQPGLMIGGGQEQVKKLPDDNPMYSGWGNGGWAALAYAIDPARPDDMQVLERVRNADVPKPQLVIHPTHRWRGDFREVSTSLAETSFLAPDGVTLVPETYDLGRSVQLMAVTPGQEQRVYVTHENPKITYAFKVDGSGRLGSMEEFVRRGEYSNLADASGNVYLAEGEILVLDQEGMQKDRILLDERVQSMCLGGREKDQLFVTTSTSLYRIL